MFYSSVLVSVASTSGAASTSTTASTSGAASATGASTAASATTSAVVTSSTAVTSVASSNSLSEVLFANPSITAAVTKDKILSIDFEASSLAGIT